MSSEWRVQKISALGEFDRGKSKHRPRDAAHLYGGPYPFVQTGDVTNSGGRITTFRQTYSDAGLAQSRLWPAGTLAITIAANIAETALLTFPACFPDSVVGFTPDPKKADVRFVEYLFQAMRKQVKSHAYGSAQENINLDVLRKLEFPIPPLSIQSEIADYLSLLDDRITLIRETNATLEGIAQALFKSWFVDFDPVRSKMEGREPQGMDEATAGLFPDAFEESEMGLVPKGWEAGKFSDLLLESTKRVGNTDAVVLSAVQTGKLVRSADHFTKRVHSEDISKYKAVAPYSFAYNPSRINIGSIGINEFGELGAVSPIYVVMTPKGIAEGYFIWHQLRTLRVKGGIETMASGTVRQSLSYSDFSSIETVLPDPLVLKRFQEVRSFLYESYLSNENRIDTLSDIRETLLPRLISGQLRIPEATEEMMALTA